MAEDGQNIENQAEVDDSPRRKRAQSDLRSTALLCHNQISKELWGKRNANSFVDHLSPNDVEAFALDMALRVYWELQKENDEFAQCSLSKNGTSVLRKIILELLEKNQQELTTEYSFEIPDPVAVEEREKLKQQQLEDAKKEREEKREKVKLERLKRQQRLEKERLRKKQLQEEKAKTLTPTTETESSLSPRAEKLRKKSIVISKPPEKKPSTEIKRSLVKIQSTTTISSRDNKDNNDNNDNTSKNKYNY